MCLSSDDASSARRGPVHFTAFSVVSEPSTRPRATRSLVFISRMQKGTSQKKQEKQVNQSLNKNKAELQVFIRT